MAEKDCNQEPVQISLLEDLLLLSALARGVSALLEYANGFEDGRREVPQCRCAAHLLADHAAEHGDTLYDRLDRFFDLWRKPDKAD